MENSPLEFLAQKYGNVVKYDADGNPSLFVKFPKMKSSELHKDLPAHTHPAFIINGIEQDYILLGRYKAGENGVKDDALVSLPNIMPVRSCGADEMLSRMKMAGAGITGMTVADYGFIKLLAQKKGWKPNGNTAWGQSHVDAVAWETGETMLTDDVRAYEGHLYTCLKPHTTAAENRPDVAPTYWEKGEYVGGVSVDTEINVDHQTGYRTLSGTGPLDWYLGENVGSMADLVGCSMETQYGYRVVDGEIQILPDNNAADPDADLSASSGAWKAILPSRTDDSYFLVAPGSKKTLHWNYLSGKIVLDTETADLSIGIKTAAFVNLAVNSENLPFVPCIIKELGLIPTGSDDETPGICRVGFIAGERLARRGGYYGSGNASGLGAVDVTDVRDKISPSYGCRSRALAEPLIPKD